MSSDVGLKKLGIESSNFEAERNKRIAVQKIARAD